MIVLCVTHPGELQGVRYFSTKDSAEKIACKIVYQKAHCLPDPPVAVDSSIRKRGRLTISESLSMP